MDEPSDDTPSEPGPRVTGYAVEGVSEPLRRADAQEVARILRRLRTEALAPGQEPTLELQADAEVTYADVAPILLAVAEQEFETLILKLGEREVAVSFPQIGGLRDAPIRIEGIRIRIQATGPSRSDVMYAVDRSKPVASVEELAGILKTLLERYESMGVPVMVCPEPDVRWKDVFEAACQTRKVGFETMVFGRGEVEPLTRPRSGVWLKRRRQTRAE